MGEKSVVVQVGESSSAPAYGVGRQQNGVAYERAPPQQQSFLESIRAKHTTPVAI